MGGGGLLAGGETGEETEKGQKGSPPCRREGEAGDSMTACGRDPTGEATGLEELRGSVRRRSARRWAKAAVAMNEL